MINLNQVVPSQQKNFVVSLLVFNGFLIALMLALAKEVTSQGIPPITYAFWQTIISGFILLLVSFPVSVGLNRSLVTYCVISGLTGIAIPNAIAFVLVTKIGAGFTGIMYALPPVFTFFISVSLGLEKLKMTRLTGLLIAVAACTWIVFQRNAELGEVTVLWYTIGIVIPIMLSIGNVYRSLAWPKGIKSMLLAAGTLLASALSLGIFGSLNGIELVSTDFSLNSRLLLLMQGLLTALTYFCSFELQKRSNPVFYSQLGAVAAVFGLAIGIVWFDEVYSLHIWMGVFMVVLGLRVSNKGTFKLFSLDAKEKQLRAEKWSYKNE